jgi:hypothetical protein
MRRSLTALVALTLVTANACGGDGTGASVASGAPLASASPSPSPSALPTVDPSGELCQRVGEMQVRLADLRSVELVPPNRTLLEIELDKLQATHTELERTDMGEREDELEDSLTRLGYRMGELDLAVEDFRTNPKPRRAVPHVEEDSEKVFDELNAFIVLAGC